MLRLVDRQRLIVIRLRLIYAREKAKLSQGEAAAMLGMHRPTLSYVESGVQRLRVDMLLALCELYRADPGWVLRPGDQISDDNPLRRGTDD